MKLLKISLIMFLIIILVLPQNIVSAKSNINLVETTKTSTWLWNTSEIVIDSDKIINFLVENKVKVLYLQIDYALEKEDYNLFISKASEKNIAIYALEGAPNWASSSGEKYILNFFKWLTKYQDNSLRTEKFQGVHLDVEPYLNDEYVENPNEVLERYQECLIKSKGSSNKLHIDFSIDIPFWFHEIKYKNKYSEGNLSEWIFKKVKAVTIMAYRDKAVGNNGIIEVAEAQLKLCEKYKVKVNIAVETGEGSEGDFITFFEEGQAYMYNELKIVCDKYSSNNAFDGVAIHYLNSWMNMKK